MFYRFGDCELDLRRGELRRDGHAVALQPKPLALLALLIEERHRVVPKEELLDKIWSDAAVTESSLTRAVSVARKALGDRGEKSFIRSFARRGYRFVGAVTESGSDAAATPRGSVSDAFVGRAEALRDLSAAWKRAAAGNGQVVLVRGEAGIGKSRLVEGFANGLRTQGVTVLEARAGSPGAAPAYWLWVQVLREIDAASNDAVLAPVLAQTGVIDDARSDAEGRRFEFFDAVIRVLRERVVREPMVIVLEDIHGASRSSLLLLDHLADRIHGDKLLVIATVREETRDRGHPLHHTIGQLAQAGAPTVSLTGFTRDEVETWLVELLGREAPARLVDALMEKTEGNPLFLREAVRMLDERGQLAFPESGDWALDALPERTSEFVQQVLSAVSPEAAAVLEAGSVLGREFSVSALAAVTGESPADLLDLLDEAVSQGIAEEQDERPGTYRFAHPLFHDGAYQHLRPSRRTRLHAKAADTLIGADGEPGPAVLAEWAYHLYRALPLTEPGQVLTAADRAAEQAERLYDWDQAALLHGYALEALEHETPVDDVARLSRQLRQAAAYGSAGDRLCHREVLNQALDLSRALEDHPRFAEAAIALCELTEWGPRDPNAKQVLVEALEKVGAEDEARARLLARQGFLDIARRRRSEGLVRESLSLARAIGSESARIEAASCIHLMMARPEGIAERQEISGELESGASTPALRALCAIACIGSATDALVEERPREAVRLREAAASLAGARPNPALVHQFSVHDAGLDLLHGKLDAADRSFREALTLGRQISHPYAPILFVGQSMYVARERGTLAENQARLPDPIQDDVSQVQISPFVVAINAAIWAEIGKADTARLLVDFFGPNIERLEGGLDWLTAGVELANAVRWLGDDARARILLEMLAQHSGLHGVCTITALYGGPVARALGLLSEQVGELAAAEEWMTEAIERASGLGARAMETRARCELGRVVARRGRNPVARELLGQAESAAVALGMAGVAREAREALPD